MPANEPSDRASEREGNKEAQDAAREKDDRRVTQVSQDPRGQFPEIAERIFVLYDPKDRGLPTEADLIFLHGINSNEFKAWTTASGVVWPAVFLPQDFPRCRVISCGYTSDVSEWSGATNMTLMSVAEKLLRRFRDANVWLGRRPIIFVTHSLGGLVAKALLLSLLLLMSDESNQMLSAVRGVVFYATPHRGSSIARYVSTLDSLLGKSMKVSSVLKEMTEGSESLEQLNANFLRLAERRGIRLLSFGEGRRVAKLFNVVDVSSANPAPDSARHEFCVIDAQHFDICVPSSKQADSFRHLHRFLLRTMKLTPSAAGGAPLGHGGSAAKSALPDDPPAGEAAGDEASRMESDDAELFAALTKQMAPWIQPPTPTSSSIGAATDVSAAVATSAAVARVHSEASAARHAERAQGVLDLLAQLGRPMAWSPPEQRLWAVCSRVLSCSAARPPGESRNAIQDAATTTIPAANLHLVAGSCFSDAARRVVDHLQLIAEEPNGGAWCGAATADVAMATAGVPRSGCDVVGATAATTAALAEELERCWAFVERSRRGKQLPGSPSCAAAALDCLLESSTAVPLHVRAALRCIRQHGLLQPLEGPAVAEALLWTYIVREPSSAAAAWRRVACHDEPAGAALTAVAASIEATLREGELYDAPRAATCLELCERAVKQVRQEADCGAPECSSLIASVCELMLSFATANRALHRRRWRDGREAIEHALTIPMGRPELAPFRAALSVMLGGCQLRLGELVSAEQCLLGAVALSSSSSSSSSSSVLLLPNSTRSSARADGDSLTSEAPLLLPPSPLLDHCVEAERQQQLGVLHHRRRDWAAAEAHFRTALALQAMNSDALSGLGWSLLQRAIRGRASAASAGSARWFLRRAVLQQPVCGWPICGLGRLAQVIENDWNAAERHYHAALAVTPTCSWAAQYLGDVALLMRGDHRAAMTWYDRALGTDGTNSWAAASLGLLMQRRGSHADALRMLHRAHAADPTNTWALDGLVQHHKRVTKDEARHRKYLGLLRAALRRLR